MVYSFGQNKFGELGLGHDSVVSTPTIIPDLTSINKLTCGRHHSAAIDGKAVHCVHSFKTTMLFLFQRMVYCGCGDGELEVSSAREN